MVAEISDFVKELMNSIERDIDALVYYPERQL